jgi:hypothetical protein
MVSKRPLQRLFVCPRSWRIQPEDHSIIAIAQQHKQWVRSLIQTQTCKLKRG